MRLIDADKLTYQIDRKIPSYTGGNDNFVRGFKDALLRFKSMVHSAKTIEATEIKHGKWEYDQNIFPCFCSECGQEADMIYAFCPHCGANMETEKDGDDHA